MSRKPLYVPPTPPLLLPGRSAYYWVILMCKTYIPMFGAILVLIIGGILSAAGIVDTDGPIFTAFMITITVLMAPLVFIAFPAAICWQFALWREKAAGYTTTWASDRLLIRLWQLDHVTGEVVRMPDDSDILSKEWKRLQAAGGRYTDEQLMANVRGKPGWYPDYHKQTGLRWWDGASWTEHTG